MLIMRPEKSDGQGSELSRPVEEEEELRWPVEFVAVDETVEEEGVATAEEEDEEEETGTSAPDEEEEISALAEEEES